MTLVIIVFVSKPVHTVETKPFLNLRFCLLPVCVLGLLGEAGLYERTPLCVHSGSLPCLDG